MTRKRSRHKRMFHCPYCQQRLWPLKGEKYNFFYEGANSIKNHLNIPSKRAKFLASKGAYVDSRSWLEEFFCFQDGAMWMLVSKQDNGSHKATLAEAHMWKQAANVIDPDLPNPSVSEYTYRASRGLRTN